MRLTIERLRAGVVAGAALLLAVLAGILLYARSRTHELLHDLPSRLGADIQKQTNGVTYSQTVQGRIVYTVHAAKATQRRDGEALLENAGLVLYGEGNGRADRIYGKSFRYNQTTGVVQALGVVQLDLSAPAPVSAEDRLLFASGEPPQRAQTAKMAGKPPIHVTTSDLVYSQKLGVATTGAPLHFEYSGMAGDATGASYNAKTGFTTLEHDVRLSGIEAGRRFVLTAAHGELDRVANQILLSSARLKTLPDTGAEQQVTAAQLVIHLAAEGGIEQVAGSGGVQIEQGGDSARAPLADLVFRRDKAPERVQMRGGVDFLRKGDLAGTNAVSGSAADADGRFDAKGALADLLLTRDVSIQAVSGDKADVRRLTGHQVLLEMVGAANGRRWVRQITADGNAEIRQTQSGAEASTDGLLADRLQARMRLEATGVARLDVVTGTGHTVLRRAATGLEETSRADAIEATFALTSETASSRSDTTRLVSAVQHGGVVLDRAEKKSDGSATSLHATAPEASYDGAARQETLSEGATLSQGGRTVRADRVRLAEETGDAEANGNVEVSLPGAGQPARAGASTSPPTDPVHAVAARAVLHRSEDTVTLFGSADRDARMWRGASQVQAPVIAVRQREGMLDASGPMAPGRVAVHTILASEREKDPVAGSKQQEDEARVVRVDSERLHYTDTERRADFLGGVMLRSAECVVRAQQAQAFLNRVPGSGGVSGSGGGASGAGGAANRPAPRRTEGTTEATFLNGGLERVIAEGGVDLQQPGRSATGAKLVYTAADGIFVLTGTPTVPPKVVDEAAGVVTGAVLRFRAGDNSVAVEGGSPDRNHGRVHTELELKR